MFGLRPLARKGLGTVPWLETFSLKRVRFTYSASGLEERPYRKLIKPSSNLAASTAALSRQCAAVPPFARIEFIH